MDGQSRRLGAGIDALVLKVGLVKEEKGMLAGVINLQNKMFISRYHGVLIPALVRRQGQLGSYRVGMSRSG